MKTAVTYSVVPRKNPREKDAPVLFYAQAQARGEADIRALSERIEVMCTVTRADVMAVLVALETVIKDCLSNGEIVRLGELGALQMSLSSKGELVKEKFTAANINKSRILFRPGETLAGMQKTLRYERVQKLLKKKEEEPLTPEEGQQESVSSPTDQEGSVMA